MLEPISSARVVSNNRDLVRRSLASEDAVQLGGRCGQRFVDLKDAELRQTASQQLLLQPTHTLALVARALFGRAADRSVSRLSTLPPCRDVVGAATLHQGAQVPPQVAAISEPALNAAGMILRRDAGITPKDRGDFAQLFGAVDRCRQAARHPGRKLGRSVWAHASSRTRAVRRDHNFAGRDLVEDFCQVEIGEIRFSPRRRTRGGLDLDLAHR